jgi:hypothetical protein
MGWRKGGVAKIPAQGAVLRSTEGTEAPVS